MDGRIEEEGVRTSAFEAERPADRRAGIQRGGPNRWARERRDRFGPRCEDAECKRN